MPGKSGKKELEKFVTLIGAHDIIFPSERILTEEELLVLLYLIDNVRYSCPRNTVPKSRHWLYTILLATDFDEKRFRQHLRMDQDAFIDLTEKLKSDPVFLTSPIPAFIQIATSMNLMGTFGNNSSYNVIASKFGVSEGTVDKCITRTIEALNNISQDWIKWPGEQERQNIGTHSAINFLPKCLGYVDGSDAILYQAPSKDKEVYWSRKKKYSIQFQIVCDPFKLIRHLVTGFPGSVHDAKVYSSCLLFSRSQDYFSNGEFIIGDSAYANTPTVVTPFKKVGGHLTRQKRKFNKHISSRRVFVEHTIGILKGRWQSLRGLRVNVNEYSGHVKVCHWIQGCVILHNFLMKRDPWNKPDDFIFEELEPEEDYNHNYEQHYVNNGAEQKRNILFEIITSMV